MIIPKKIKPLLKEYSLGHLTAERVAWEIQQLKVKGVENPSVSEVILWSRQLGYGVPDPSDELVAAEVARAMELFNGNRSR